MTDPASDLSVVVTGDVTMDWNLARVRRSKGDTTGWGSDYCTRAYWQPGRAGLLANLIEAIVTSLRQTRRASFVVRKQAIPQQPIPPGDRRFHHSYAIWSRFPFSEGADDEPDAWRVEEFLGLDRCPTDHAPDSRDWQRVVDDTPEAQVVVLDDGGLGFRESDHLWPAAITAMGRRPWILHKMTAPVAQGKLWEHLHTDHADRLIVTMTVEELRRTEVQISRELSWERTAQDLFWELVHNPRVNALSRCAHVVISFGPAGAALLSRQPAKQGQAGKTIRQCSLTFDPQVIEGRWEQDHPGRMIGYSACLTAAIARQLVLSPDQPDLHQGIQSGLAAMRKLHLEGYGQRGGTPELIQLTFPIDLIVAELGRDPTSFDVVEVQDPARFLVPSEAGDDKPPERGFWTILEDRYRDNLDHVAEQIVRDGADAALRGVPLARFGDLLTVDRCEVESLRTVRTLVREYCLRGQHKRPLSIAVFGAPGSGKSFGITQVAGSLLPGQIDVLEFNLSQFRTVGNLLDALHQVRDVGLGGMIPLVFWDEFDTTLEGEPLGWLRYFLAPMQEGHFQEGQISHPIGRAIFVFAGGTSVCMEEFGQGLSPEQFRGAKGPDFVSRLKGFVNILGPNQQRQASIGGPTADRYYIIRRAIVLRSLLERNAPQLFEKKEGKKVLSIHDGVLRAFLKTRKYRHGIRSMEAIIAMSLLAGKRAYERSSLPTEAQLNLHVDGQDFCALAELMKVEGDLLEMLAKAAHEVFCESLRIRGYRYGPETDDKLKTHSSLRPYAELPGDEQDQNRGNVRDILDKLTRSGYVMMPARSNEPPFDFPGDALETLARMEHERWVEAKQQAGWQCAPETNKSKRLHRSLVPWGELPELDKEKDRELVRRIPDILARVGYTVKEART